MKRLLMWPLVIVGGVQIAVWSFWFLGRLLGLDGPDFRFGCWLAGFAAFVISLFPAGIIISLEWPDYLREQDHLREQRERLMAELDAQIGIPRIPVKR